MGAPLIEGLMGLVDALEMREERGRCFDKPWRGCVDWSKLRELKS